MSWPLIHATLFSISQTQASPKNTTAPTENIFIFDDLNVGRNWATLCLCCPYTNKILSHIVTNLHCPTPQQKLAARFLLHHSLVSHPLKRLFCYCRSPEAQRAVDGIRVHHQAAAAAGPWGLAPNADVPRQADHLEDIRHLPLRRLKQKIQSAAEVPVWPRLHQHDMEIKEELLTKASLNNKVRGLPVAAFRRRSCSQPVAKDDSESGELL